MASAAPNCSTRSADATSVAGTSPSFALVHPSMGGSSPANPVSVYVRTTSLSSAGWKKAATPNTETSPTCRNAHSVKRTLEAADEHRNLRAHVVEEYVPPERDGGQGKDP